MSFEIKMVEEEHELNEFLSLAQEIFPLSSIDLDGEDVIFISYLEDEPVGFIHFGESAEYFTLKGIGVKQEYRKQGIGGSLLENSLDKVNGKPVFLKTTALNPAINLYSNFGFVLERFGGECVLVKKDLN